MTNNKNFWLAQMIGASIIYAIAAVMCLQGHSDARLVLVVGIILGLHVLEIPLAFRILKGRDAQPLRVIVLTFLFGLLWWIPARRGLLPVR